MPLLLLKYWKYILTGGLLLVVGVYVGFLKLDLAAKTVQLAHAKETITAFKLVQKQNEALITDQNKAIGKMKTSEAKQEKASIVSAGILSRAVEASQKPVVFKPHSTCDADVRTVFEKLRSHK